MAKKSRAHSKRHPRSRPRGRPSRDEQLGLTAAERLADSGWIEWGAELIWVAGFTSGGAPYGLRAIDQLNSEPVKLAQLVAALGYFDQAHLARGFRTTLGRAPLALSAPRGSAATDQPRAATAQLSVRAACAVRSS